MEKDRRQQTQEAINGKIRNILSQYEDCLINDKECLDYIRQLVVARQNELRLSYGEKIQKES